MAADFKVYGFCENKCRREVMLKEDIEEELASRPKVTFATEEPSEVAEGTMVMVYEE